MLYLFYMNTVLRHAGRKKKKTPNLLFIDRAIYFIGLLAVTMTLPQLFSIYAGKDAHSISLVTWFTYLVASCFWFAYGYVHHEKPILVLNGLSFILQFGIVVGVILYG